MYVHLLFLIPIFIGIIILGIIFYIISNKKIVIHFYIFHGIERYFKEFFINLSKKKNSIWKLK